MGERFVVRELEGYTKLGDGRALPGHYKPGLSIVVLDSAYCYATIRQWRTENFVGRVTREDRWARCRAAAQSFADALNAKYAA